MSNVVKMDSRFTFTLEGEAVDSASQMFAKLKDKLPGITIQDCACYVAFVGRWNPIFEKHPHFFEFFMEVTKKRWNSLNKEKGIGGNETG